MKYNYIYLLLFLALPLCASADVKLDEKLKKDRNFIEKLDSDDPEVQRMLQQLREDYKNQKDQINNKYGKKKKQLRNQKDQEMQLLTKSFKNKTDKIKKRYPKKVKTKMRTKPLKKSDMKYLDPRENSNNLKKRYLPRSKKKADIKSKAKVKSKKIDVTSKSYPAKIKPKKAKDLSK